MSRLHPVLAAMRASERRVAAGGDVRRAAAGDSVRVALGDAAVDARLHGGLERATLHELFAPTLHDICTAAGFAALIAQRSNPGGERPDKPFLWLGIDDKKQLYAPGLVGLGCDPACFTLVHAPDYKALLRAAGDIVKCGAVGALVIEGWEKPAALDLTVTRRLALAAAQSGVFTLLLRHGPDPPPSAARTRWRIAPAPSAALAGNAPGSPAFDVELIRHRGGVPGFAVRLEWNCDTRQFAAAAPLSGGLVAAAILGADQNAPSRAA
jgi:protein ImuA